MNIGKFFTKEYWKVEKNYQIFLILLTFSISGFFSMYIADIFMKIIGFDKNHTISYIFWPLRILCIFPLYQISLLIIGTILGQFNFFLYTSKKYGEIL